MQHEGELERWDEEDFQLPNSIALHLSTANPPATATDDDWNAHGEELEEEELNLGDENSKAGDGGTAGEEQEGGDSNDSSRQNTIKGLLGTFSALSLASTTQFGTGTINHLLATPRADTTVDWDDDFESDLPAQLPVRTLHPKSSFASHISDDADDDLLTSSLPPIRTKVRQSAESFDDFDESDFELPTSLSQITLSPNLAVRTPPLSINRTLQLPSISQRSHTSGSNSMGDTSAESEQDDESFFEQLVLPSYFLGGPGAMTPPSETSDGELGGKLGGGKIDLQDVLKRKLAARGRLDEIRERGEKRVRGAGGKLDGYREDDEDEQLENGLHFDEGFQIRPERFSKSRVDSGSSIKDRQQGTPTRRAPMAFGNRPGSVSNPNSTVIPSSSTFPRTAASPPNQRSVSVASTRVAPSSRRPPPAAASAGLRDRYSSKPLVGPTPATPPTQPRSRVPRIDTTIPTPTRALPPSPVASPIPSRPKSSAGTARNASATTSRTPQSPPTTISRGLLARKPSTQNLTTAKSTILRSPTPGNVTASPTINTSPSKLGHRPSISTFAAPTSASSSRSRVRSGPTPYSAAPSPTPTPRSTFSSPSLGTTRPTTRSPQQSIAHQPKGARIASTGSSGSGSSWNGLAIPPSPINLNRPKRLRKYGDGTELNDFDDLPTNKDREQRIASRTNSIRTKGVEIGGKTVGRAEGRGEVVIAKRLGVKRDKEEESALKRVGLAKRVKKEPQLIRNLGPVDVAKGDPSYFDRSAFITNRVESTVQSGMTWNPVQQRWEGNESALAKFDKIPTTSNRPALITQLQTNSPGRPSTASSPFINPRANNVKVVGSMIFDPIRMCWLSMEVDGEEELDFSFGAQEDEGEMIIDGWEQGEQDRMRKNRMSFALGQNDERSGALWAECVEAEQRQELELRSWIPSREVEIDEKRERLWDIRRVSPSSALACFH